MRSHAASASSGIFAPAPASVSSSWSGWVAPMRVEPTKSFDSVQATAKATGDRSQPRATSAKRAVASSVRSFTKRFAIACVRGLCSW